MPNTFDLKQTLLNPSPTSPGFFGNAISIDGNLLLIGAPSEGSGEPGIAYLFDTVTGNLEQSFLNPTPDPDDGFGSGVAISGSLALIGARNDDTGASNAGTAYLYNATNGDLLQTFLNPTPEVNDQFGEVVANDGNLVLIGALGDNTGATSAGAAYLYDATTGNLSQTFLNPTPATNDFFGGHVAIDGNLVLIGASQDDTGASNAGEAYLYDATTGNLLLTISNPTPATNEFFGVGVDIDGNNLLIASRAGDAGVTDSGAAYLFDATTGNLLQTFLNPNPDSGDSFSAPGVAIDGNNVLIGASGDDISATNGGVAYLYDATTGDLLQTILNPTPDDNDRFGSEVDIFGDSLVVGAPTDDAGANNSGVAHLYEVVESLNLVGTNQQDTLVGGAGNDTISGGNGADELFGLAGDDILGGDGSDNGPDLLDGGLGNDTLTGGNGPDIFVLAPGEGTDTITDFSNPDVIGLADGLTFGDLSFASSDIIFGTETLATLTGIDTTTLTASDFTII